LDGTLEEEAKSDIDRVWYADAQLEERVGCSFFISEEGDPLAGGNQTFHCESGGQRQVFVGGHSVAGFAVNFARGEMLAQTSPGGLSRLRLPSLDEAERIITYGGAEVAEFIPGVREALSFGSDDVLRRWDLASGQMLLAERIHSLHTVAISPGGRFLIVGDHEAIVHRDLMTNVERRSELPDRSGPFWLNAINRDGSLGIGDSIHGRSAWDFDQPSRSLTLDDHFGVFVGVSDHDPLVFRREFESGMIQAVSVSDGTGLGELPVGAEFLASAGPGTCLIDHEGEIHVWSVAEERSLLRHRFDGDRISSCAYSEAANRVVFLADEWQMFVWEIGGGVVRGPVVRGEPCSIAMTEAGDEALTAGQDGAVRLFQLPSMPSARSRLIAS
jgi:hypothetical protein